MSNLAKIPYTELFERLKDELIRDRTKNVAEVETKYKGFINDAYLDFIGILDEDYIRKTATITTKAPYTTGTAYGTLAGTTITGISTAWTSALTNGSLFKLASHNTVYRVNYSSGTELTLVQPSAWIEATVALADADTYRILFDRYALASDFSHIVMDDVEEPEAVYSWSANSGASRFFLRPKDFGQYQKEFNFTSAQASGFPAQYSVNYVNGLPYMYIWPCDSTSRAIFYQYIPQITPMQEVTGTAACTTATTAVTTDTDITSYLNTAETWYIRFDGDGAGSNSKWYEIASYSGTSITLSTALLEASKSGSAYTLCNASKWPARFDKAIIYGAALLADPNAQDAARWMQVYGTIVPRQKAIDGTRRLSQRVASPMKGYQQRT